MMAIVVDAIYGCTDPHQNQTLRNFIIVYQRTFAFNSIHTKISFNLHLCHV